MPSLSQEWKNYEDVTRQIIYDVREHLGISKVESKQKIKGKISGTEWEVEVVAYDDQDGKLILVECRQRLKSRLPQESIGGFGYRIKDTGAKRGIIVTSIGLQKGAKLVANAEKITEIILDYNSTCENYVARITNQIFAKFTEHIGIQESVRIELRGPNGKTKKVIEK